MDQVICNLTIRSGCGILIYSVGQVDTRLHFISAEVEGGRGGGGMVVNLFICR